MTAEAQPDGRPLNGIPPHPLLAGAVDTHIHPGPSYIKRRISIVEAARQASDAGMRALVVKDHHMPTVAMAQVAQGQVAGVKVLGSLVLNASVGGCNPDAVEASVGMGAAVVWLPTVSARNHRAALKSGASFPASGRDTTDRSSVVELVTGRRPTAALSEVLEVLADNAHVVLATGHASAAELEVILPAARSAGVRKIVITHPAYLVGAGDDELRRWTSQDAYAEIAGSTSWSGSSLFTVPIERTLAIIRSVGRERVVISSDFGQLDNPAPVTAMTAWLSELLAAGVSEDDLALMLHLNPAVLLDLD